MDLFLEKFGHVETSHFMERTNMRQFASDKAMNRPKRVTEGKIEQLNNTRASLDLFFLQ